MKPKIEIIQQDVSSSIHTFRYENEFFESPWHFHPEYELTTVLKSTGMRYVGEHIENFSADDLVLLGPNIPHCWKNTKSYTDGAISLCVQWKPEDIGAGLLDMVEMKSISALLELAKLGIKFSEAKENKKVRRRIEEVIMLPPFERIIEFLSVLRSLSERDDLVILTKKGSMSQKNEADERIIRVTNYLEESYQEKITLDQMADITHLTKVAFCKFFKKRFNKSFISYLHEYRVRKACSLLQATDMKVDEIGYECGFNNGAFFHRQFLKITDTTPASYRKWFKELSSI